MKFIFIYLFIFSISIQSAEITPACSSTLSNAISKATEFCKNNKGKLALLVITGYGLKKIYDRYAKKDNDSTKNGIRIYFANLIISKDLYKMNEFLNKLRINNKLHVLDDAFLILISILNVETIPENIANQIGQLLLTYNFDVNYKKVVNFLGYTSKLTLLMGSSYLGDSNNVKLLIDSGADLNIHDLNDTTALMLAAGQNRPEAVYILLIHDADASIVDNTGKTFLDYAQNKPEVFVAIERARQYKIARRQILYENLPGPDVLIDLINEY